jgi:hypothetical protein
MKKYLLSISKICVLIILVAFIAVLALNAIVFGYYFPPNSVVIKITSGGGIGNQLFQYAAGYAFAKENNKKIILFIEKNYSKGENTNSIDRKLALTKFPIKYDKVVRWTKTLDKIFYLKNNSLWRKFLFYNLNVVKNSNFFEAASKKNNDVVLIDDFPEAEMFFQNHSKEIKKLFNTNHLVNAKTRKLSKELKKANSVCIHMRRGDFNEFFLAPFTYQKQAINLAQKIVPNARFYIFF